MKLFGLGLGEPFCVSAMHGRNVGDLLDEVVALLPESHQGQDVVEEPRFALVGRPNVGKSSLFNQLLGEERSVVYEEAGTTRDAVDAVMEWEGKPIRFVDTAGLRSVAKSKGVEYYGLLRTMRAIERADVVLLVIDASDGFTGDDKRIAKKVMELGRGLVVAANKWDLVDEKDRVFKDLSQTFGAYANAPILRTSALRKVGIPRLPEMLLATHARWSTRVSTAEVNKVIERAQLEVPAPRGTGRARYVTQVQAGPPTFVLFGAKAPDPPYHRYLERRLREAFGFEGVPVVLRFRPKERRDRVGQ
jgi:GTP-binding protein